MTLLRAIEVYLWRTGISMTRFGREAIGDPKLIPMLRRGRQLRPATMKRVLSYIAEGEAGR